MRLDYALVSAVEVEDVFAWDRPDFADAFIASATYAGQPMTQEQLDALNADADFVHQAAHQSSHR
jgi:hypothetical protein